MNKVRKFRYDDVVSASDGRLVSQRGMHALYDLFDFLTNDSGVTTLAIAFLADPVKKYLHGKYPFLANQKVKDAVTKALNNWKAEHPTDDKGVELPRYMDFFVLPLMPSEEIEIEAFAPGEEHELANNYGEWLRKTLDGKKVVAVVAP